MYVLAVAKTCTINYGLASDFLLTIVQHTKINDTFEQFYLLSIRIKFLTTVEPRYNEEVGNIRQKFQEIRYSEIQLVNSV